MTTWTPAELDSVGAAHELKISSQRPDGSTTNPVTIWVVRVGDELYVRSAKGQHGGWYRGAERSHQGHVEAGGAGRDVGFEDVGEQGAEEIDSAYKEKYGYPSGPTETMVGPGARATTIRLVPR